MPIDDANASPAKIGTEEAQLGEGSFSCGRPTSLDYTGGGMDLTAWLPFVFAFFNKFWPDPKMDDDITNRGTSLLS